MQSLVSHICTNAVAHPKPILVSRPLFLAQLRRIVLRLAGPLGLELPLSLDVVLGRVDAVLVVVHKVEPGHAVHEQSRVAALAGGHTLHMGGQTALSVQRLAGLDLGHHLLHVEVDLARVLRHAVEAVRRALAEVQEAAKGTDGARETHGTHEAAAADVRGRELLHQVERGRAGGGHAGTPGVVRGPRVPNHPLEMATNSVSISTCLPLFLANGETSRLVGTEEGDRGTYGSLSMSWVEVSQSTVTR
jgi:hypothetical protein